MYINSLTNSLYSFKSQKKSTEDNLSSAVKNLGSGISLANENRNYNTYSQKRVDFLVKQGEKALPLIEKLLQTTKDRKTIIESLYVIDRMIEADVKGIEKLYPTLSRFNKTQDPNVQTLLAGIYRKTQVPDAFGPLMSMLITNSLNPRPASFDPNEEIGGAVLEYIK